MSCISDFGLSRQYSGSSPAADEEAKSYYRASNAMLPVRWCAPEIFDELKFDNKTDVLNLFVVRNLTLFDVKPGFCNIILRGGIHIPGIEDLS